MKANAPNGIAVFDYYMPLDLAMAIKKVLIQTLMPHRVKVEPHDDGQNGIKYKFSIDLNNCSIKDKNNALKFVGDTFEAVRQIKAEENI